MIPSKKTQSNNEAILSLSAREKIALDAYLFNPANKVEAYKVAKGINAPITDAELLNARANRWLKSVGCKAYLDNNKELIGHEMSLAEGQMSSSFDLEDSYFTKDQLIIMLQQIINRTNEPNKKADYILKLADLQGYKKESSTKEEKRVLFYLPLRCSDCSYFKSYNNNVR